MNPEEAAPALRENPFSTCYTRPGALAFLFSVTGRPGEMTMAEAPDAAFDRLVEHFQQQGGRGQIVGPHGSGKSTLLAALLPRLANGGAQVVHLELHDGQRRLPCGALARVGTGPAVIVVDGYEQLAWWSRLVLRIKCRRRRWGLLVTAHADVGLPTIYRTASSAELANKIVSKLLHGDTSRIGLQDVQSAYAAAGGDVRQTLFALYDLYEARSLASIPLKNSTECVLAGMRRRNDDARCYFSLRPVAWLRAEARLKYAGMAYFNGLVAQRVRMVASVRADSVAVGRRCFLDLALRIRAGGRPPQGDTSRTVTRSLEASASAARPDNRYSPPGLTRNGGDRGGALDSDRYCRL